MRHIETEGDHAHFAKSKSPSVSQAADSSPSG